MVALLLSRRALLTIICYEYLSAQKASPTHLNLNAIVLSHHGIATLLTPIPLILLLSQLHVKLDFAFVATSGFVLEDD
jgi:hypothetical protein